MRFPVSYAYQNVLFGAGGERAALYRLGMVSYPLLPTGGKWDLQRRLERLAHTIGGDFSLWRVCREWPAEDYVRHTEGLLDARHQDPEAWRAFLSGHEERLRELGSHTPEVYLAVSLNRETPTGWGAGVIRVSDRIHARVRDLIRSGGHPPIPTGVLRELLSSEQRIYERLAGVLACERASTMELQWLARRAATRGVGEPEIDRYWSPQALSVRAGDGGVAFKPLSHTLWQLGNVAVTERERMLVVDGEHGPSFQAMLALGALADAPLFPGGEAELLFAPLENAGFPVDAVLHARWIGNRDALTRTRKRIADVENSYREQIEGSAYGPGWQAEEDRALVRDYESTLQSGARPPMLTGWVGLAVAAPSEAELERRVALLKEHYGDVRLHRPAGLQHQLWADHLPRPDGGATRDYARQLTVEQFGGMIAVGTRAVGSHRGPYLGYTPGGSRRPVRFDPSFAPRADRASAVLLVGTLGSGKSVTAQSILYAAERMGSLVVDFDPKPDHGFHQLGELKDRLEIIELSGDPTQQGRLDPLTIGFDDLREELACSYLLEVLRDPPAAWENAITRAVRDTVAEGSHSLQRVVHILLNSENTAGRDAGEALEVIGDFGLARLAFSDGQHTAQTAGKALTTIRMPGLTLPDPLAARDSYTRSERISVATLSLIAAYSLRLIAHDRSRHKIVLLDEVWFLLSSVQGRSIINRLIRLGRALNATLLLSTHHVGDLGDLADLIGERLVFGVDSDAQAEAAQRVIGLPPTPEVTRALQSYRQGMCLMRDLYGRVSDVQIDPGPRLLKALGTTPESTHTTTTEVPA